ncbi:hypothetical protein M9Y10_009835 [Tritrichomonas musculus]|uniref:DDE-1 domain-containing protein n=1 Tax=Tritrichomonas musculus TaxID=1915356 RepID=A0ABR2IPJ1_9EUKA
MLKAELPDVPVGLVFNPDESGQNQFVDARDIFIFVPEDVNIETYPVNRSIKRITLLHCISTDGSSCDPMIIVPRLTLDNEIFEEITSGSVLFCCQVKGFCEHELFTYWFIQKFIPYLKYQRERYQYFGKSVIIMDGFKGHEKSLETLENVLNEFKIKIILIPPHSSDQVQPLDLFGFNLQKNETAKFTFNYHYSYQTNTILRILEGLNKIKSPHNVTVAWQMAGIFRDRCERQVDPNGVIIQNHIVDIQANTKIRSLNYKDISLNGSNAR